MNASPAEGRAWFLSELREWRLSTVPVAVMLIIVQALAMPLMYAETRVEPRAEVKPDHPPAITSLGTPGLDEAETYGGMTPLGEMMPEVRSVAPRPEAARVGPEKQAEVIARARARQYDFQMSGTTARAVNPRLGLALEYGQHGMRIAPRTIGMEPAAWEIAFRCEEISYDETPLEAWTVEAPDVIVDASQASREVLDNCSEWWINREDGIEHGFTLEEPAGATPRHVRVMIAVATELLPSWTGSGVAFKDASGKTRSLYEGLVVQDAVGATLAAEMRLADQDDGWHIILEAEVDGAVWPVTIDPVVGVQEEETLASDGGPGHEFGHASDGVEDVVAVSSPSNGSGKVYLFHQNQGGVDAWDEAAAVVIPAAETPVVGDRFGEALAMFVDEASAKTYLAVGAPMHDGTGGVFIYERNAGGADSWGHVQTIVGDDSVVGDGFGGAVDGLGSTLVVGAKDAGAGAAYVFELAGGSFAQTQKLTTPNSGTSGTGLAGDEFGAAVALGGDHMVIGAPGELAETGGAYLYQRGSPYVALSRFFSDKAEAGARFGAVVAMAVTGLLLAVGMPFDDVDFGPLLVNAGAVFIYALLPATLAWGFVTGLFGSEAGALFGSALALNFFFDLVVGAPGATSRPGTIGGAVFVYLFNALLFTYSDGGSKVVPSTFIDQGMALGTSVVLLGTALFVLGSAYNFAMGAMFRFTLAATLLTFALWQQLYFTQDQIDNHPETSGRDADPDGDRLTNEMEHAMFLIPVLADPRGVFGLLAADGRYVFTFRHSLVAVGVQLLIQYSLLLSSWHLFGQGPFAGSLEMKTQHAGIQARQVQVTISTALALLLFMRLETVQD